MRAWRAVTFIETVDGERGGRAWILTLECGHVAVRAQPGRGTDPVRLLMQPRLAPKRVVCHACEDAEKR